MDSQRVAWRHNLPCLSGPFCKLVLLAVVTQPLLLQYGSMAVQSQPSSAPSMSYAPEHRWSTVNSSSPRREAWLPINCSEEQQTFYADVFSKAWLTDIVVVGTPTQRIQRVSSMDYYLRVNVARVLKGDKKDLLILHNSNNRIPIFVRVSNNDTDSLVDLQCLAYRRNETFEAHKSDIVQLGKPFFFFLEATDDPTLFKQLFSPTERKNSMENTMKRSVLPNQSTRPACEIPPRLQVPNSQIVADYSYSVSLLCQSANVVRSHMRWARLMNDSGPDPDWLALPIEDSTAGPFAVERVANEISLRIQPVDYRHAGFYRCHAVNLFGESYIDVELRVIDRPVTKLVVTERPKPEQVDEKTTQKVVHVLNCTFSALECQNGGRCNENVIERTYECLCEPGYFGTTCESYESKDSRPILSSTPSYRIYSTSYFTYSPVEIKIWSNISVLHVVAVISVLLLVTIVSIVALLASRLLRRRPESACGFKKSNRTETEIFSIHQENTLTSTTCVSPSNTNNGDSACGSADDDHDHKSANSNVDPHSSPLRSATGLRSIARAPSRHSEHIKLLQNAAVPIDENESATLASQSPLEQLTRYPSRSQSTTTMMLNSANDTQITHSRSSFAVSPRRVDGRLVTVQQARIDADYRSLRPMKKACVEDRLALQSLRNATLTERTTELI